MWLLFACTHRAPTWVTPVPTADVGLSPEVSRVIDRYPTDGTHAFHWPPDDGVWWGTTRDVSYLGVLVSPADPLRRAHCVGLTWEVAMEVLQAAAGPGAIGDLDLAALSAFRTDWFVRELGGVGAAEALERAGLGRRVEPGEAVRGDFLQLWALGSGHSGVFDAWETEEGRIVGVRYWSVHPTLGRIGYWTDSFKAGWLEPVRLFVGRIDRPARWRSNDRGAPQEPVP